MNGIPIHLLVSSLENFIVIMLLAWFIYRIWIAKSTESDSLYTKEPTKEKESVVADIEPDKPEMDPDKIVGSTNNLRDSIVSIIANMDSKGPLSVCINGIWGSGKSTLINSAIPILRSKHNCTCVLFNAWHHESEHHLYAALIEEIKKSWIPRKKSSYPQFESSQEIDRSQISKHLFKIYFFLWKRRFSKSFTHGVQFILFLLIVSISFVVFWILILGGLLKLIGIEIFSWIYIFKNGLYWKSDLYFTTWLMISFVSWIYFWYSPYNTIKAFAATPVSQVYARTSWLQFSQFAEQLSFRYRFSISFKEVCKALNSVGRKLVIIIDDIDRCNKDQILEVLEAVNFLCTNGPCFVLLTMDKKRVIEMLEEENNDKQYYQDFLKKVFNLTINVQPVSAEEFQVKRNK